MRKIEIPIEKSTYIKGLDGLRALAIIFVVIHHSHFLTEAGSLYDLSQFFNSGVDLFFIISGYLINEVLLRIKGHPSFFKKFYLSRALRIIPLYFVVLFIAFFILPNLNHSLLSKFRDVPAWPYWTFLSNYYIAWRGHFQHGLINLSWSLSVEEQFYLFWSLCVYFFDVFRLKRVAWTIVLVCPLLRILLAYYGVNSVAIHVMSITRFDTIMMGVLLSFLFRERTTGHLFFMVTFILSIIFYAGSTVLPFYLWAGMGYSSLSLFYTSLVGFVLWWHHHPAESGGKSILAILELRGFRSIGLYSYGIYLIHNPLQKIFRPFFSDLVLSGWNKDIVQVVFYLFIILTAGFLGGMSYHFFEKRWIDLKRKIS